MLCNSNIPLHSNCRLSRTLCFASLEGTLRAFLSWLPFSCFLLLQGWEKEKKNPNHLFFFKLHLQLLKDKTSSWNWEISNPPSPTPRLKKQFLAQFLLVMRLWVTLLALGPRQKCFPVGLDCSGGRLLPGMSSPRKWDTSC